MIHITIRHIIEKSMLFTKYLSLFSAQKTFTNTQSKRFVSNQQHHSACPCEYPCVATFAPKKAVAGSM